MLLEISGEITPERMKGWSQSKNTQGGPTQTAGTYTSRRPKTPSSVVSRDSNIPEAPLVTIRHLNGSCHDGHRSISVQRPWHGQLKPKVKCRTWLRHRGHSTCESREEDWSTREDDQALRLPPKEQASDHQPQASAAGTGRAPVTRRTPGGSDEVQKAPEVSLSLSPRSSSPSTKSYPYMAVVSALGRPRIENEI